MKSCATGLSVRFICQENNNHLKIAGEPYFLSAEGYLMPTKKEQPPPNLKYFKPAQK